MATRVNPLTGQLEDENGTPILGAPAAPAMAPTPTPMSKFDTVTPDRSPPPAPALQASNPLQALEDATTVDPEAAARKRQILLDASKAIGPDTSTNRQRAIQTPEEKAALAKKQGLVGESVGVAERAKDLGIKQATDLAAQDAKEQQIAEVEAQAAQQREAESQKKLADADAYLQQQRDAYAEGKNVRDMFEGRDGARVMAALSAGLGAFASALTGGKNYALDIINSAYDRHYQSERMRIEGLKEMQGMAGAEREKALAIADLQIRNRQAASKEVLAKQRAALVSRTNPDKAAVEGDAVINGLRQSAANDMLEIQKGLRTVVSQSSNNSNQNQLRLQALMTGVPVSDKPLASADANERKADHFTNMASQAAKQLKGIPGYAPDDQKKIESYDATVDAALRGNPVEKWAGILQSLKGGTLYNSLSPAGKQRYAAETTFITATLRPESGAAIGENEYSSRAREIRLAKGEGADAEKQRAENMAGYIAGNAMSSFRPGYWRDRLKAEIGGPGQMTPRQHAEAMKFVRDNPNNPRAKAIAEKLRAGY